MDAATARRTPAPPDPDLREDLIAEAKSVLSAHPRVFLSRGKLVEVVQDRERTWLAPLRLAGVKKLLWLCGPWQHFLEENMVDQPSWLPSVLLQEESWPDARRLTGITDIPVLRPDGSLLTAPGYDAATRLWYAPSFPLPELPAKPTHAHARAAAEELGRILDVFPVVSQADRSALLAALLTPLAGAAFQGPSPLFVLDTPGDGPGGTQAAELLGHLLRGRSITRMEKPSRERQFRRQLARLQAPDDGLLLLEGAEELRSAASLSTALLRWEWTDGREQRERRRLTWFARSSNADVTRESAEGLLPIRSYDTDDHSGEASFDWPHPLDGWCAARRAGFVRAALVLLRAYICAGRPEQPHAAWPQFSCWSDLIAGALLWVGLEDPILARRSWEAAIGDDDAAGGRRLVTALAGVCAPGAVLTTKDILRQLGDDGPWLAVREALQELLPGRALDARHLGNLLRTCRGVSVAGVFLQRLENDRLGFARWTVECNPVVPFASAPAPAESGSAGSVVTPVTAPALAVRAESAESSGAGSVETLVTAPARAVRAESAESGGAGWFTVPRPVLPPGSARALFPNFDAELERVTESLRASGGLDPRLTRPPVLPQWSGVVPGAHP